MQKNFGRTLSGAILSGTTTRSRGVIQYGPVSTSLTSRLAQKYRNQNDYSNLKMKSEHIVSNEKSLMSSKGMKNLNALEDAIDCIANNGYVIGSEQVKIIRCLVVAGFKVIFGSELVHHLKYLSTKYNMSEVYDSMAVIFPRRQGKTMGIAMFAAAWATTQPYGNVSIYNLNAKNANMSLGLIRKFIKIISKNLYKTAKVLIGGRDTNCIMVQNRFGGTAPNKVFSYPGTFQGKATIGV
jgi:hypothetical protein